MGVLVTPDWDMFHSLHPRWEQLCSKAVSERHIQEVAGISDAVCLGLNSLAQRAVHWFVHGVLRHVAVCAFNSLFMGVVITPDRDMFRCLQSRWEAV
jgi:hypothetical protein